MHRIVSRRPSPATIISLIALFVALGGTSFAAVTLVAKNSVGSPQVINGSLLKKDLSKKTVAALKGNRGLRGLRGAAGAAGAAGTAGATGPAGTAGATGPAGTNGTNGTNGVNGTNYTIQTTLKSGETETGVYAAFGRSASAGGYMADGVNFRVPLAADIPSSAAVTKVHFLPAGTSSVTHCPGIGQADPGHICIYEVAQGNSTYNNAFNPTTGLDGISKLGFNIYLSFDAAGAGWSYGEWAVTASGAVASPSNSAGIENPN